MGSSVPFQVGGVFIEDFYKEPDPVGWYFERGSLHDDMMMRRVDRGRRVDKDAYMVA